MTDFSSYQSPYTWRYGTEDMRRIWGEEYKRLIWRRIWAALAAAQNHFGLTTMEQVDDLRKHADEINIQRAFEIEQEVRHDVMAEIRTYAEQCSLGGGIIHLGATSMDISDNAEAIRIKESLSLVLEQLKELLAAFADKIVAYKDLTVMAYTHIQPAEPTTLGYRLAQYTQDLLDDFFYLQQSLERFKGKGFKGAVGTAASYAELIGKENLDRFEELISAELDLDFFPAATQTYPRKQEYQMVSALAGVGASLHKFAFDLRILQSPPFGELSEPFNEKQVGSTAMPFKRNPITSEKTDSLGRLLAQMPRVAWDNAAHSLLERTLDDSANRRTILPESFLIVSELLRVSLRTIQGLKVNLAGIQKNMETYGPFAATERVLMESVRQGADRQEMHEKIRQHALDAWEVIQKGDSNPLISTLTADSYFTGFLTPDEISQLMDASEHTGFAAERAVLIEQKIRSAIIKE